MSGWLNGFQLPFILTQALLTALRHGVLHNSDFYLKDTGVTYV